MALTFGMSAQEFWEEDPNFMWAYQKSYIDQKKIEKEMTNFNLWLQGMYIYDGFSKAIYNSFGRKEGMPVKEYPNQPYDLNKTKEDIEREQILETESKIKARNKEIAEIIKRQNKNK